MPLTMSVSTELEAMALAQPKVSEAGLFDDAFIVDLQIELEGVATGQAAHFADGVGIFPWGRRYADGENVHGRR